MRINGELNDKGYYPIEAIDPNEIRYDYKEGDKIGLIDADLLDGGTRHPNLAIMKLAGYFGTTCGCEVKLIENYEELCNYRKVKGKKTIANAYGKACAYSAIFVSKVFTFTNIDSNLIRLPNVFIGGSGFFFDKAPLLPDYIEHHKPDYHIYDRFINNSTRANKQSYYKDYLNYSIGFATRGCFRQCEFCINRNIKKVGFHSHISEWYDESRRAIYLWDDNILGYPHWEEVFEELKETGKPFQFRQGLDIRLLDKKRAEVLNSAKYHGDIIFAFDHIEEKDLIEAKLRLWRSISKKPTKLFVLAGFDSQDWHEIRSVFERISIIIKYGCFPFIMKHEKYKRSVYKHLFTSIARWCNQPGFIRNLSFREFCEAEQKYIKTEGKLCSSKQAMVDFETKHPDIAKEYFDMKFKDRAVY